jgi:ABC-type transport system involved in multi-copper enzyme maturation permease subunit
MKSIWAIAKYTVLEQIRNRLYLVILFFGGVILTASLLLGALAPDHKVRVILDLGLIAIELFSLAAAVFGAVTLVLQEMESKTIYLILTRPVHRSVYVLGRYFGLVAAVVLTMMVMAMVHVLVMVSDPQSFKEFTYNQPFWSMYPVLILMSGAKMMICAAIAVFFSLFATSSVSALIFSGCFWIAGHFGPEINFLLKERVGSGKLFIASKAVLQILPNFQFLNFRDQYSIPGFAGYSFISWALLYTLGYSLVFLIASGLLFSRKEF